MKFLALTAAVFMTALTLTPAPASAAPTPPRYHGWKWRTVCTTRWHHGRRVRVCRRTRVRW